MTKTRGSTKKGAKCVEKTPEGVEGEPEEAEMNGAEGSGGEDEVYDGGNALASIKKEESDGEA